MKKATLSNLSGMIALNFFNSKEVYAVSYFSSKRKAENHAKKFGYEIVSKLPEGVDVQTYLWNK